MKTLKEYNDYQRKIENRFKILMVVAFCIMVGASVIPIATKEFEVQKPDEMSHKESSIYSINIKPPVIVEEKDNETPQAILDIRRQSTTRLTNDDPCLW